MEKKLEEIKSAVVAVLTVLGSFLGWKGVMALVWVAVMALDYFSGTAAAWKEGKWASSVARVGLWHKLGMILAVAVSAFADFGLEIACEHVPIGLAWPGVIMPLVLAWYILTELGSILENAVKLGARVPKWLTKLLATVEHMVDDAADKVVDVGDTVNPYAEVFPDNE
jgi:toxin secretion/phage lysis holin